jgi:hypothetical protein
MADLSVFTSALLLKLEALAAEYEYEYEYEHEYEHEIPDLSATGS